MKKPLLLTLLFALALMLFAQQQTKQRSELERMKRATQEMIEETNKMLSATKKSALQMLNQINLLGEQIKLRRSLIATLTDEVASLEREERALVREIGQLQKSLEEKKQKYSIAVQGLYNRRSGVDDLLFILSAESVGQSYRRMRYLQEYSGWRKQQAIEIAQQQKELEAKRAALEAKRKDRLALLGERKTEETELQKKEDTQKGLMADLKKKEKSLQSDLKKQQQQARELDRQIQKLIEEEARRAAEARKKEGKKPAKGTYAMDKAEEQLSGSFEKNKGKLPYPVTGSYVIIGRFGRQQQSTYVETINNGIDLQTKPGAEARAVFDGVVSRVFIVPGYNSSVIIRHGNYLTVYTNLSDVYVKAGDAVKTRQTVGKIFTDSANGNMTKMQFQLWKETTKLNPEPWLAR
jgi:septal ring factor EnvC (AmiA/AmiB activator)